MSHKIIVVDVTGLRIEQVENIGLETIYQFIGNRPFEGVSSRFHDPNIVAYVGDEARYTDPSFCALRTTGEDLAGPVFICGSDGHGDECGLTDFQIKVVRAQLEVFDTPRQPGHPEVKMVSFDTIDEALRHVRDAGSQLRRQATWDFE